MKEKIELFLIDLEHYTIGQVQWLYKTLSRVFAFAKLAWKNYDWDNGYLLELEVFKLKRMQYEFLNHGHHYEKCSNYEPKMKSLKLTIKLGDRLMNHDYCRFLDLHNKKWGERKHLHIPVDVMGNEVPEKGAKYYRWETEVEKATTPELKEQEKKEFLEAYNADERERYRDRQIFYRIIGKYGDYWWD